MQDIKTDLEFFEVSFFPVERERRIKICTKWDHVLGRRENIWAKKHPFWQ